MPPTRPLPQGIGDPGPSSQTSTPARRTTLLSTLTRRRAAGAAGAAGPSSATLWLRSRRSTTNTFFLATFSAAILCVSLSASNILPCPATTTPRRQGALADDVHPADAHVGAAAADLTHEGASSHPPIPDGAKRSTSSTSSSSSSSPSPSPPPPPLSLALPPGQRAPLPKAKGWIEIHDARALQHMRRSGQHQHQHHRRDVERAGGATD